MHKRLNVVTQMRTNRGIEPMKTTIASVLASHGLLLAAVLVLTGCSRAPSPEQATAETPASPQASRPHSGPAQASSAGSREETPIPNRDQLAASLRDFAKDDPATDSMAKLGGPGTTAIVTGVTLHQHEGRVYGVARTTVSSGAGTGFAVTYAVNTLYRYDAQTERWETQPSGAAPNFGLPQDKVAEWKR